MIDLHALGERAKKASQDLSLLTEEKINSALKSAAKLLRENSKFLIMNNCIFVFLGILGLKFGGELTVNNAVIIAEYFKLSEQVISLTILAVGTSLPELVTSVVAAAKGNSDIAIGNIIGSNIFNMLFVIGVTSLISPIVYNVKYNIDMTVVIISTIVLALFPLIPPKNMMSKRNGATYLVGYILYLILMFNV